MLFSKRNNDNKQWKIEYIDTVYKIYDWDKNLTGYFFPNYDKTNETDDNDKTNGEGYDFDEETEIIDKMHKENFTVFGGNLMLPMIKLYLLDNQDGIDLDYAISTLEENVQRTKRWKEWIQHNHERFEIIGSSIYTAREDRDMLSILLGIDASMTLGEKELLNKLRPLLDKLHEDKMI
ncbi:MAG TPA: hypothetical protein VER14_06215 [Phototrophicaceae bacterium]|nr:hypothetical protein [Phototrophicaceae bacterium]